MKTYAELCLERSNKATEGPWITIHGRKGYVYNLDESKMMADCRQEENNRNDAEFIAASREMVPELARRLQRVCKAIRDFVGDDPDSKPLLELADELEALPKEEK